MPLTTCLTTKVMAHGDSDMTGCRSLSYIYLCINTTHCMWVLLYGNAAEAAICGDNWCFLLCKEALGCGKCLYLIWQGVTLHDNRINYIMTMGTQSRNRCSCYLHKHFSEAEIMFGPFIPHWVEPGNHSDLVIYWLRYQTRWITL